VTRLADQQAKTHHTQIPALTLGMPATCQLARRHGRDVGVEIGCVERKDISRKFEAGHSRLRDRDLRLF
jgi:hypothetical protein